MSTWHGERQRTTCSLPSDRNNSYPDEYNSGTTTGGRWWYRVPEIRTTPSSCTRCSLVPSYAKGTVMTTEDEEDEEDEEDKEDEGAAGAAGKKTKKKEQN